MLLLAYKNTFENDISRKRTNIFGIQEDRLK